MLSGKTGEKIKVSSRFLAKLIKNTSHVVKYDFGDVVPVHVSGKTELTPGELFVVMRSASNAYHSLKLKTVLERFRRVLEEPEALKRAADQISSSKNFRKDFKRALTRDVSEERISEAILRQNPKSWAGHGFLHPDRKKDVLNDLLERRLGKFGEEHLNVLARASGLPRHAVTLFNKLTQVGVTIKELLSLVDESKAKPSLNIRLSSGMAVLDDTGLGTRYAEKFYKYRSSGSSGYLQERGAKEILRDIHDGGAKTTVIF
ncbi:hypothetical protein HZC09_00475 [Candidatus Micrarchaeota archaeon]|nr:hypothetical protein [Candidatus Micrarchaeota archaeon]